jgi:hypothetical protein
MLGVTPVLEALDESANPSPGTLPAPGSNGVAPAALVVATGADDAA